MDSQLIPVFNGSIANESTLLCNARDLHSFLDVGKRFASWIAERIADYGFVENQDYVIISQIREKSGRGRPPKDYHLTLDTAKELAMVERNDKGRQVRRYFIECEKLLNQKKTLTLPATQPLARKITLTDKELRDLVWMWVQSRDMLNTIADLCPLLEIAGHRLSVHCRTLADEYPGVIADVQQTLSRETRHIKLDSQHYSWWDRVIPQLRG